MKLITREIKIYKYTFGKINIDSNTVYDLFTVERVEPMSKRALAAVSAENDGAVMLKEEMEARKFALPLELFVEASVRYSQEKGDEADEENEYIEGEEIEE